MKKVSDLLKPFLSVIFGALLFLCHFNWLGLGGGRLAIGIVALVLAVYFVTVGLLSTLLGEKFPKRLKETLDAVGVGVYPLFLGAYFLTFLIMSVKDKYTYVGPMAWTISLISIAAAFGLGVLFFLAYFLRRRTLARLTFTFSCVFILMLLLDILLINGNPATLGSIVVLKVVLYGVFVGMLINALSSFKALLKPKKEEVKPEEVKE